MKLFEKIKGQLASVFGAIILFQAITIAVLLGVSAHLSAKIDNLESVSAALEDYGMTLGGDVGDDLSGELQAIQNDLRGIAQGVEAARSDARTAASELNQMTIRGCR